MINNGNYTATKSYNSNITPDKSWFKRSGEKLGRLQTSS